MDHLRDGARLGRADGRGRGPKLAVDIAGIKGIGIRDFQMPNAQPCKLHRHRAADTAINFVEDDCLRAAFFGQRDFQRQDEAR